VVEAYLGKSGSEASGVRHDRAPATAAATAGDPGLDLLAIDDLHVYYGNIAALKG
jgi:hypothetical protein